MAGWHTTLDKHFYQSHKFRHKNDFGESTKPGSWKPHRTDVKSRPSMPKSAKLNLTRINEYKVLHLN